MAATSRQALFYLECDKGGDPAQAAVRAGYHPAQAPRVAARLLARREAPPARPPLVRVDRDTVLAGLLREATDTGKGATQACRLKAWELIARLNGLLDPKTRAEDDVRVHFDIRIDDPEQPDA